jgi:hypothetical protein
LFTIGGKIKQSRAFLAKDGNAATLFNHGFTTDQTAMGLSSVTSAVLLIANSVLQNVGVSDLVIISLLMSPLLGHRPSLWITHKENGP